MANKIRDILAVAYVLTDEGKNYVSKIKAYDDDVASSVDVLKDYLDYGDDIIAAKAAAVSDEIIDAIIKSADSLKAGSSYADKMADILASKSGNVMAKNVGVLASLVSIYARELEKANAAPAAPAAQGFLGAAGEQIGDFILNLTFVKVMPPNRFGTSTLIKGRSDDGHVVAWFASGYKAYKAGEVLYIEKAKIKKQESYQGEDQTLIYYVKAELVEQEQQVAA